MPVPFRSSLITHSSPSCLIVIKKRKGENPRTKKGKPYRANKGDTLLNDGEATLLMTVNSLIASTS
jgi:hypothetical protein